MAKKRVAPEEEMNKDTALEGTVEQDSIVVEDGLPPGVEDVVAETVDSIEPVESTAVAEEAVDHGAVSGSALGYHLPDIIEMPTESEMDAGEYPVSVEMEDVPNEPRPSETYGGDFSESPDLAEKALSEQARDWGFQEELNGAGPVAEPEIPPASAKSDRQKFFGLKFHALDRDLTRMERQEWNTIYASYRGRSAITGTILGVDPLSTYVWNPKTERREKRTMFCATVVPYRVPILIPESEMWEKGNERPYYVMKKMSGSKIDFIITQVFREDGYAIGSRRLANNSQRHFFAQRADLHRVGAQIKCQMMAVGPRICLVECYGHDIDLTQRDLRYASIPDLQKEYHSGMELECIVKAFDTEKGSLKISIKETEVNPFFGAEQRHPVGSRRLAVIAGKYGGGVFCNLPDGVVCMCNYSYQYEDSDFMVGENVMLQVHRYDNEKLQMYGKIMSKW